MNKVRYDNFYYFLISFFSFVIIFLLVSFPDVISSGIRNGLFLCANTLIASMFPFFVLSSFLLRTGAVEYMGKFFDRFSRKVFRLSGNAFSVFFISLFSGFPVGAKLVSSMFDEKKLSLSQSSRLMCCCVNAGPAFVIGAVGNAMLSNRMAGLIIFVSLSLSAFFVLFFSRFFVEEMTKYCFLLRKKNLFLRVLSKACTMQPKAFFPFVLLLLFFPHFLML